MKLLRSERTSTRFGKIFSNYGLWNVVRVWFFLKNCANHRLKRIEAVRAHRYSCKSWNERLEEFVNAPFAQRWQRSHHVFVWSNWRQDSTILTWRIISMQLTVTRLRRWGTLEFTILLFFKHKPQNAVVLSLEPADVMAKATLKQLWKRFNEFYMASDLYQNIWSCWNTDRATTWQRLQVNQCRILLGIAKKYRPFLFTLLHDFCTDSR